MQDLIRSIEDGVLTIRSHDAGGTATVLDRISYPVYGRSTDYFAYPGTGTIDPVCTDGTITINVGDALGANLVWSGSTWGEIKPTRARGRSVVRRNHRGLQPRAVNVDFSTATPEEITALQLLRGLVGQDEFRRYLKYGFVMVQGQSGLRYQVKRGRHVVDVWNERGRVDGICVYLQGRFPPTDDVITRMLMAERDELELWRRGNSRLGRNATLDSLMRLRGGNGSQQLAPAGEGQDARVA